MYSLAKPGQLVAFGPARFHWESLAQCRILLLEKKNPCIMNSKEGQALNTIYFSRIIQ